MQNIKAILHEINNADQIVMEIREQLETLKGFDFQKMVELNEGLEGAVKLFETARRKVDDAIIQELDDINNSIGDEAEEYNHAKESGDIDYSDLPCNQEKAYKEARTPY